MCCMRVVGNYCIVWAEMDMDTELNTVSEEQLKVEETDDSC